MFHTRNVLVLAFAARTQDAAFFRHFCGRSFSILILAIMMVCYVAKRTFGNLGGKDGSNESSVVFKCSCGGSDSAATVGRPTLVAMDLSVLPVLV
jgi:hypothetical protein